MHSPRIDKVEVERQGAVRRAKLTYLRKRIGKSATAVRAKGGRREKIMVPATPATKVKAAPADSK
jgi:hypothetical protein